ncbi:hypothetical protein [Yonghaparkia sp. Root332]|uniref:PKD domain-containing protein n=1 Tax=Yonghaparkia sp. Root332 TaxID=1736516 RepID=UPI000A535D65|nr:hypothetical protein [Yonghaparkia sp. Root332]
MCAKNGTEETTIEGTESAGSTEESSSANAPTDNTVADRVAWTPPPGIPPWVVPVERCVAQGDIAADCTAARPGAPAAPPPADSAPGTPGITIRDVASFRPELATLSSEPDGWAVRGLHANVLAAGGTSIRTGELFGITAEVRFTPVAYLFDYGDGSAPLSTSTPGATWAALGLDEFDATPTSHVYESSGTYAVTLLVDYAAEYRIGGSGLWTPIPGTLAIPSDPVSIVVADSAATALVDRDCAANPRGPGC